MVWDTNNTLKHIEERAKNRKMCDSRAWEINGEYRYKKMQWRKKAKSNSMRTLIL